MFIFIITYLTHAFLNVLIQFSIGWQRSYIFKFKEYDIDVPTIGDHILGIEGHRYRLGYRDEPRIFSKISSARGGPKIPGLTTRLYEPIHWLFKSHDLDEEFNKFYQEIVRI